MTGSLKTSRPWTCLLYTSLGKGEDMTGGRKRPSVVSDAMEAVIGAIYLDGGLANAKEFIHRFILNDIEHKQLFYDSKTILQEIVQADFKDPLTYELIREMCIRDRGEIEAAAGKVPEISSCACVYDQKKQRILFFYDGTETDRKTISSSLSQQLPRYMLPSRYVLSLIHI